jgi:carboxyl-terminal processing protease
MLLTIRRMVVYCGVIGLSSACASDTSEWRPLSGGAGPDERLTGVWENPATGHVAAFSPDGTRVFHVLGDYCIRDTGVVPAYSLYRFGSTSDEVMLHYYDYRDRPELLQAPSVFRRMQVLPAACANGASSGDVDARRLVELIVATFDRFYAFFEERQADWETIKQRYSARAGNLSSEEQAFDLLEEMLAPLGDGHVNVTWSDRSFNTGRPELRARLRDEWAESDTELSEGAFVSAWHRGVVESVYDVLDPGSSRSGAANALEWGTIADSVGYVRINRFSGFTDTSAPRPVQYDSLDAALDAMRSDLAFTSLLIVDVAMNGGGSDAAAQLVAARFADERRTVLRYEAEGAPAQEIVVSPRGDGENRPVLLLTSEVTASAAESFVLMMRAFPHVTQVGGRTRGGLSSLLPKPFPNGFLVTLSYQRVLDADGTLFEGIGIPADRPLELFPDGDLRGGFASALSVLAEGR